MSIALPRSAGPDARRSKWVGPSSEQSCRCVVPPGREGDHACSRGHGNRQLSCRDGFCKMLMCSSRTLTSAHPPQNYGYCDLWCRGLDVCHVRRWKGSSGAAPVRRQCACVVLFMQGSGNTASACSFDPLHHSTALPPSTCDSLEASRVSSPQGSAPLSPLIAWHGERGRKGPHPIGQPDVQSLEKLEC